MPYLVIDENLSIGNEGTWLKEGEKRTWRKKMLVGSVTIADTTNFCKEFLKRYSSWKQTSYPSQINYLLLWLKEKADHFYLSISKKF